MHHLRFGSAGECGHTAYIPQGIARGFYNAGSRPFYTRDQFMPRVDISRDDQNIYLEMELSGLTREDIKISVTDERQLIIKGEKKSQFEDKEITRVKLERHYGTFERSFQLPPFANAEKIDAKFENGLLTLTIARIEPEKPKEVNVDIN